MKQITLETVHNDLEFLKQVVVEIKIVINLEPELRQNNFNYLILFNGHLLNQDWNNKQDEIWNNYLK